MYPMSRTEPAYRGQRHGHVALALLLCYSCDKLGVRKESFVARIGAANSCIVALLTGLGFVTIRTVAVFDQVEMQVADADVGWTGARVFLTITWQLYASVLSLSLAVHVSTFFLWHHRS
jgi:hypothetical protein